MTIFQRNKKTERGRQRFGGEGKKGKKCAWNWGTKGRKHSPGHIKDIKRKQTENMSDMKTLVSVVTDNACLWLGEAWAACLCPGTSESYRSQAFDQGSVLWERRLKETSPGATKGPFCFFSLAFPSLFIFRESGWGEHGSVGKQQSWLSLSEPDFSHTLTRCDCRPRCSLSLWSIMPNIWCHERKAFDT